MVIGRRFDANSMTKALTNSLEKLYRLETVLADRKQAVGVLSTDMSKAFDSLYSSLLLEKPEAYGVSHNSVALLHSYLNDRKNRVKIGNTTSEWNTCNCGCPQGSALRPALWNSNQNDLFYESIRSQLSSYADDHQLYINGNNVGDVIPNIATWWKNNRWLVPRRTTWKETYPNIELWFLVTLVKHRQLLKLTMLPSRGKAQYSYLGWHWMRGSIFLGTSHKFVPRPQEG